MWSSRQQLNSTSAVGRTPCVQQASMRIHSFSRICSPNSSATAPQPRQSLQQQPALCQKRARHARFASVTGVSAPTAETPVMQDIQQLRSNLQLYNTMNRCKEPFKTRPQSPNDVSMYVCGVTVYDYSHIGHARVYTAFDVLYRVLTRGLQYNVQYVRNFTDIDDKIIARAAQNGEDPLALASRFIDEFHKDINALNCLPPTMEPRATDFIQQMIDSIQAIIKNGYAYAVEGGDVYFEVSTLPGYGALSGRTLDDNRAGERVAVDERKRGAADFALWKAAKPGEPAWDSPWGKGRPGWHIECSAMIHSVMGNTIDIHGGGRDLVFPHHENELAQSRAAYGTSTCCNLPHSHHSHGHQQQQQDNSQSDQQGNGVTSGQQSQQQEDKAQFVRYWVHNGFVNVDSEKMSKSLGNFFTIRDVLELFHPLALRWFLISTHYRAPVNYSSRALEEASDRLYYVYQALLDAEVALTTAGEAGAIELSAAAEQAAAGKTPLQAAMLAGLLDDLNTPAALSELSAPLKTINDLLTTKAGRKQPDRLKQLATHQQSILYALQLLGLLPAGQDSSGADSSSSKVLGVTDLEDVQAAMRRVALKRAGLTEEEVQQAIKARADARAGKDYAAADAIRLQLASKGVAIMDTPQGTTWRPLAATQAQSTE